jgi:hypothetical protein
MKTRVAISLLVLAAGSCAYAADAPTIALKKKSSFAMEASGRNPFWPIGWKPAPKVATQTTDTVGPEIPDSAFVLSSVTVDSGTRFAIINGRPMAEGQVFGLQMGTQTYQLTVKTIEDGRVILSRHGQELIVPLRRK